MAAAGPLATSAAPVAVLAYGELFENFCNGTSSVRPDQVLAQASLYWLTNTYATAARYHYDEQRSGAGTVVSQGRIGAVISAKPVERRMMLEEAAGISGLHARRKDAEQKLRATEANLLRLDEIQGDQEARAAALRRQARAAARYRELTDRIRLAEARLIFARWAEADRAARAASDEAAAAESEVARLQTMLAGLGRGPAAE